MLGIVGLLAVLSISYIRNIMPNSSVILLLSAIGFMLLFGRLISFVSLNVIILDYWEKRILGLIFIPLCLLISISLIGIRDRIQSIRKDKNNLSVIKKCLCANANLHYYFFGVLFDCCSIRILVCKVKYSQDQ